jgi:receptor protein-tyrosine kinase
LLDRAAAPSTPFTPQKRRSAIFGVLTGLLLGAGYVFLRDYISNTIKDADDVERYLHLDLLAAVPRYGKENVHVATEAYQGLRTALLFARKGDHGQIVLVTGTAPGEGKTHTLLNLAKVLAVSGESTVVVDGDLRRAALHHRLVLAREPGLTDIFTRGAELSALLRPTKVKNMFALTAGPLPPNPPAFLARPDLGAHLEQLRLQFRWVLLDSPPLASVTDALLLARYADLVVLVVQHNKVDKKVVKRSLAALRKVTPNVLGAVLNAVDLKAGPHYYYYYPTQSNRTERVKGTRRSPVTAANLGDAPLI